MEESARSLQEALRALRRELKAHCQTLAAAAALSRAGKAIERELAQLHQHLRSLGDADSPPHLVSAIERGMLWWQKRFSASNNKLENSMLCAQETIDAVSRLHKEMRANYEETVSRKRMFIRAVALINGFGLEAELETGEESVLEESMPAFLVRSIGRVTGRLSRLVTAVEDCSSQHVLLGCSEGGLSPSVSDPSFVPGLVARHVESFAGDSKSSSKLHQLRTHHRTSSTITSAKAGRAASKSPFRPRHSASRMSSIEQFVPIYAHSPHLFSRNEEQNRTPNSTLPREQSEPSEDCIRGSCTPKAVDKLPVQKFWRGGTFGNVMRMFGATREDSQDFVTERGQIPSPQMLHPLKRQ